MPTDFSHRWLDKNGNVIACKEKNKVMQENMQEFAHNVQDIFEDAILMGCEENQVKEFMIKLIESLPNPYNELL
ncbi:MAG: hypothetical protein GKC53_03260 [Neisseriaceae bacterium]|nr:MAG: hypothetical protein GKC53_03260 [Neisseriaceae bacterium]